MGSLVACNQTPTDSTDIEKQIASYEVQISDLQDKIKELKTQLPTDENSNDENNKTLVGISTAEYTNFTHYLEVTGNVESQLEAFISPEINGLIKSINVEEGDFVKKGQLLASIDTDMIKNSIDEVKTQLELSKTVYNKQKELWDQNIGSELQYLQAKTNKNALENKLASLKTQLSKASIKAPFDAYVETVYQKIGEIGSPGRQIIHLVNLTDLKVTANISESYIPFIHKGDMVIVDFPTFPNKTINAKINVVGAVINPNNRTLEIQIPINNNDKLLKPNIIANIKLIDFSSDSALIVPSIVIKNDADNKNYIYVADERNGNLYAKKTYVKTGKSYGNKTMIIDGIKSGDKVIVQGYNLVKNSSLIKIK
jgi:RND family efflux transporter MFP subunit